MTETIKLSDLQPDSRNANKGSERGEYMIRQSLQKLGAGRSIVVDRNGQIIAGNKTAESAADVGIDDVILVRTNGRQLVAVMREDLDLDDPEGQARQLAYADNRASETSLTWDAEVIGADIAAGVDLGDWFQGWELEELGITEPDEPQDAAPQIDRAEELREKWGVEPGQLWRLPSRTPGQEHRIYCGDSTKREEVARLIGSTRASLMVTDPPYGVAYHSNKKGKKSASIEGDLTQAAIPLSFAVAVENILDDDARLYLFGGTANWPMYSSLFDHYLRMQPRPMIWVKETFVLHPTHYHSQYETVFFGWKGSGGGSDYWYGDRKGSDVWMVSRDANKDRVHPTQKPVEVVEIPIRNSAPLGGIVYEPFSGSGTTIIAAENLSRQCRAVEISPGYVAVALERYATAFGIEPERR